VKKRLITLLLDAETLERLDKLACELGLSRSALLRKAINFLLNGGEDRVFIVSYPVHCLNCGESVSRVVCDGVLLLCEKYRVREWWFIVRCPRCKVEGILRGDGKLEPISRVERDVEELSRLLGVELVLIRESTEKLLVLKNGKKPVFLNTLANL